MTTVLLGRGLLLLGLLAAALGGGGVAAVSLGPGQDPVIDAFPPWPNGRPPGASSAARATAATLGRG